MSAQTMIRNNRFQNILSIQLSNFLSKSHVPLVYESKASYKKWFQSNMTANNELINGPDYTFLDGRPTPQRQGQKIRAIRQKTQVEKAMQFMKEIEFAEERYRLKMEGASEEKHEILRNKFKVKNVLLDKPSN